MLEKGTVYKVKGKTAVVRVDKKEQCEKCGMCLFKENATHVDFSVKNSIGAKVGDIVEIQTVERTKLLGTALVFLVPLLLIGLGVLFGFLTPNPELFVPIIAVGLVIVWFFILSIIDKAISKKSWLAPTIVGLVSSEQKEEESKEQFLDEGDNNV